VVASKRLESRIAMARTPNYELAISKKWTASDDFPSEAVFANP